MAMAFVMTLRHSTFAVLVALCWVMVPQTVRADSTTLVTTTLTTKTLAPTTVTTTPPATTTVDSKSKSTQVSTTAEASSGTTTEDSSAHSKHTTTGEPKQKDKSPCSTTKKKDGVDMKVVDNVLIIGGAAATAAAVAGSVAAGVEFAQHHKKGFMPKHEHHHYKEKGSGDSSASSSSITSPMPIAREAVEMYPAQDGLKEHQLQGVGHDFRMPASAWMVVIVVAVIGAALLLCGCLHLLFFGGSRKSGSDVARGVSRMDSEHSEASRPPSDDGEQRRQSAEVSEEVEMPLLPSVPPLVVPALRNGAFTSLTAPSFAAMPGLPMSRAPAVGATMPRRLF